MRRSQLRNKQSLPRKLDLTLPGERGLGLSTTRVQKLPSLQVRNKSVRGSLAKGPASHLHSLFRTPRHVTLSPLAETSRSSRLRRFRFMPGTHTGAPSKDFSIIDPTAVETTESGPENDDASILQKLTDYSSRIPRDFAERYKRRKEHFLRLCEDEINELSESVAATLIVSP